MIFGMKGFLENGYPIMSFILEDCFMNIHELLFAMKLISVAFALMGISFGLLFLAFSRLFG
jgi:hypothetical protein